MPTVLKCPNCNGVGDIYDTLEHEPVVCPICRGAGHVLCSATSILEPYWFDSDDYDHSVSEMEF